MKKEKIKIWSGQIKNLLKKIENEINIPDKIENEINIPDKIELDETFRINSDGWIKKTDDT
jgi:hypothetical protein